MKLKLTRFLKFLTPIRRSGMAVVASVLTTLSFAASADAAVLFEHKGSNNPTTEGWSLVGGASGSVTASAVNSAGTPAWQLADNASIGGNHTYAYQQTLTSDIRTEPFDKGWKFTIVINVESLSIVPGATIAARYISSYNANGEQTSNVTTNHVTYGLYFGSTANGRLRVRLQGVAGDIYTAATPGFQTIILQWNPGDTGVSLIINDQTILTNYQGEASTFTSLQLIQFGIASSSATSNVADWGHVRFETVPEPSTAASLGVAGVLVVCLGGFRRFRLTR